MAEEEIASSSSDYPSQSIDSSSNADLSLNSTATDESSTEAAVSLG